MELEKIISYFKQLSAIPRQSGDEKAAGEFLVQFAKEAGLWAVQDAHNNVLAVSYTHLAIHNFPDSFGVPVDSGTEPLLYDVRICKPE